MYILRVTGAEEEVKEASKDSDNLSDQPGRATRKLIDGLSGLQDLDLRSPLCYQWYSGAIIIHSRHLHSDGIVTDRKILFEYDEKAEWPLNVRVDLADKYTTGSAGSKRVRFDCDVSVVRSKVSGVKQVS